MASDIKTLHLCCLSDALVFDTTSPSAEPANTMLAHRAISLNHGWLHRVMGISPPAGSLSAALLAWSPFRWGLGLDGSIIVPDGIIAIQLAIGCFMNGWTRLAPYLAVVDRRFCSRAFELFFSKHFLRVDPQHLQVVLAHPPKSLAPGQGAPAGKYSDNRIFSFQGARGADKLTPSLLSRVRERVENQIFYFAFIMLLSLSKTF